jgi:methyl-accepting chemotaxis protein
MAEYIRVSEVDSAKTGEFFHNIVRGIREVRDAISEIHNAMVELAAGGKEINTALASLIQISSNVNASSKEMMEGTQTISGSMTSLEAVSGETKSGMEDIMRRLESINRAVHLVSESGRKNAENVTLIEGLFSKFKV